MFHVKGVGLWFSVRKWKYAVDALDDPDPFGADIDLDPHDVKV